MKPLPLDIMRLFGRRDGRAIFDFNPRLERLLETGGGVRGSFVRNSIASYIDPATGEVKAGQRTNLVPFSQDMSQWTVVGDVSAAASGTTIDGLPAYEIVLPGGAWIEAGLGFFEAPLTGAHTISVFGAPGSVPRLVLTIRDITMGGFFNEDAVVMLTDSGISYTPFQFTGTTAFSSRAVDGGYRFFVEFTPANDGHNFMLRLCVPRNSSFQNSVFAAGIQIVKGIDHGAYIPTQGAPASAPVGAGADQPRFEKAGGGVMLLREGAALNLVPHSQDAARWTQVGTCAAAAGETIAGLPAFRLSGQTAGYYRRNFLQQALTGPHTFSFFAKPGNQPQGKMTIYDSGTSSSTNIAFNAATGEASVLLSLAGSAAVSSRPVGDGFRFLVAFTPAVDGNTYSAGVGTGAANPDDSIVVTGAQTVAGVDRSSYIPTDGAAASRASEAGFPIFPMSRRMLEALSGGEGTLLCEWMPGYAGADQGSVNVGIVSASPFYANLLYLGWSASQLKSRDGAGGSVSVNLGGVFPGDRFLFALCFGQGTFQAGKRKIGLDADFVWSDAAPYAGAFSQTGSIAFGNDNALPFHLGRVRFYGRKLTPAQIAREVAGWTAP